MAILTTVVVLAVLLLLAFFRASIWNWLIAFIVIVPVVAIQSRISDDALQTVYIALTVFVLVLGVPFLRRLLVSSFILKIFRKILPQVSQTEQEALDAGTVWWDGELFSGHPRWSKLLAFPKPALSDEEQAFLDNEVEQLCSMIDDWDVTHTRQDLPPEVWQFIKDKGFFGMIIPKSYGGLEFSALAHSAVVTKLASRSGTAAVTVMVPNSLGPAELLLQYGTQEQKRPIPAPSGQGAGDAMLCADRSDRGFRCGGDPRYRHRLLWRIQRTEERARYARDLGEALHHAGTGGDAAGTCIQTV